MKGLTAGLLILLCTVVLTRSQDRAPNPGACCWTLVSRVIPLQFVVSYRDTGSSCPKRAIIFTTKKGLHICANPEDAWVQRYIKLLDQNS
ncbi:C-C motif chemokine 18-like [Nycticebus coucang]|uniref:C-C motif chemokine 18-like n=1 Tax=Nycticebus coucang TaxID=9470 RepID=UPI00234C0E6F|nr:C-C motif chemokine 18-like [Nycticebus coucang]